MDDIVSIAIITLVGIGIGFALSGLIGSLRGDKKGTHERTDGANRESLLHIFREDSSQSVVVEMEGERFQKPGEMNAQQQKRLGQILDSLRGWSADREVAEMTAAKPEPVQSLHNRAAEPRRASLNPVDLLARAVQSDVSKDERPQSIAAQIDAILQEKLSSSPYKNKGIRLLEFPGRGMVVLVGMDQYDSVEAVPDEGVRALLHECVAEWEQKAS